MTTSSIPLKRCTKCGEEKPATLEYFHRNQGALRPDCKECHRKQEREYIAANRDVHIAKNTRYYRANHEKAKQYQKQYRKDNIEKERKRVAEWTKLNPDKHRERTKRWRRANPEKHVFQVQRRRTRQRALPSGFTAEQWQTCLEYFNHTCAYCGAQQSFWYVLEQEHFIPVSAAGGYIASNIVPACKACNSSKKTRQPAEWLSAKFGKKKAQQILDRILGYFGSL